MVRSSLLIFTRYYVPGVKAGGPIRSIDNLSHYLERHLSLRIITGDRDYLDEKPYNGIKFNCWTGDKIKIYYLSKFSPIQTFYSLLKKHKSTVYLNSLFDPLFSIIPLLVSMYMGRRVVLAPRGELSESALNIKINKKSAYLKFFKTFGFHKKIIWHVTNELEKAQLQSVFGVVENIYVANNISLIAKKHIVEVEKKPHLDLFYLGRIAKIKNLKFALHVLSKLEMEVKYYLYGPVDDEDYWEECQHIIATLPSNVEVTFCGSIQRESLEQIINSHEFLFLPTKSENFGHSIAECLSNGVPVIISDQTPWRKLSDNNAGWDLPLREADQFANLISDLSKMNTKEYNMLRRSCLDFYATTNQLSMNKTYSTYLKMFTSC